MIRQTSPFVRHSLICIATLSIVGCSSDDAIVGQAYSDYQAAVGADDLPRARTALLTLVAADEGEPDYWIELGKVQAALGSPADAYHAFSRANELRQGDPAILRALVQLALATGRIDLIDAQTRQLELIAPGDPLVQLGTGVTDLQRGRLDQAESRADRFLAAAPSAGPGKILKARILAARGRTGDAIALLEEQVRLDPSDAASLRALAALSRSQGDWTGAARASKALLPLTRNHSGTALSFIEAALRSGDFSAGRAASLSLLGTASQRELIESVLQLWARYWPGSARIEEAKKLGVRAPQLDHRAAYASFLNRIGQSGEALALLGERASLPVTAENARANAVMGQALALNGRAADAKRRFDAVLQFDPGQPDALRGRAELQLRTGAAEAALIDAQKLVTLLPESGEARILLARSYATKKDQEEANRILWQAFREIPADEDVYRALRMAVRSDPDALRRVNREYAQQKDSADVREF